MYNIMVVDDDCNIRNGLMSIIKANIQWEYQLYEASNGESALCKIQEEFIDIAVVDIKMPVMDGIELLKQLQNRKNSCQVIMLSGYDDYNLVRTALKLGAFDYLLKPVNIKTFIKILNESIKRIDRIPKNETPNNKLYIGPKHSNYVVPQFQENFFDIEVTTKIQDDSVNLLKCALKSATEINMEQTHYYFDKYFEIIAQGNISEENLRNSLTQWVYDLMKCNNDYIRVIGLNKLTERDILNAIKNLPTLSQLKSQFLEVLEVYAEQLLQDQNKDDQYIVRKVKLYIEEHYSQEPTLTSISQELYIHPNYLSTMFKNNTGVNFRDYLRNVRIEKSKEMLSDDSKKIYDIALAVGYQDPAHFNRAFKDVTGVSPSTYKRKSI